MVTTLPVPVSDPALEIAALARRYRRAGGPVIALANRLGAQLDEALRHLPAGARAAIDRATTAALSQAFRVAQAGRHAPRTGPAGTQALAALTGAMGGAGGLAGAVVEVPVTITVFLHAIRESARAEGFDPDAPAVQSECLRVLTAGSPMPQDDALDTGFIGARLALNGQAMQKLIATVAPALSAILARKLAAQAVPVLGAVTGAALNAAYLAYFRELAAIRFALMRLTLLHGPDRVAQDFSAAVRLPVTEARAVPPRP
jgi:hypothetical protein